MKNSVFVRARYPRARPGPRRKRAGGGGPASAAADRTRKYRCTGHRPCGRNGTRLKECRSAPDHRTLRAIAILRNGRVPSESAGFSVLMATGFTGWTRMKIQTFSMSYVLSS